MGNELGELLLDLFMKVNRVPTGIPWKININHQKVVAGAHLSQHIYRFTASINMSFPTALRRLEQWITLPNAFSINNSRRFFSMGFKNIRNLLPAFQRRNSNTNYLAVNKIKSQAAR